MPLDAPNKHRLAYLIASSVSKVYRIDKVRVRGREERLPLTLSRPAPGLKLELALPSEISVSEPLRPYLELDSDLECIVVANGVEVHGYDWVHRQVPLPRSVKSLEIVLGGGRIDTWGIALERDKPAQVRAARILVIDERIRKLAVALAYLARVWETVDDEELRSRIGRLVNETLRRVTPLALDPMRTAIAYEILKDLDRLQGIVASPAIDELERSASVAIEHGYRVDLEGLGEACEQEYARLLESLSELARVFGKRGEVLPVAQSHLDYLWLWSRSSFIVKLGKTVSTCLSVAREAPWIQTILTCSHYIEELSKRYPKLFEELRRCVERGSCLVIGGIWTEFDANTIDGEALARQFLYGQRKLKEYLGAEARILYLPDTFGFPPTLPEVARIAGIELFIDRKLSWNDTNRFPYMYFRWVSPSGEELLSIYAGHCYTHSIEPSKLLLAWRENSESEHVPYIPLLFGYGDGGGGPTLDQVTELEVVDRCPILPRVRRCCSLDTLIKDLRKVESDLPTWFGELYLENHRGVFSAGVELKNLLREAMAKLKVLDALRAALSLAGASDSSDRESLERAWKLVLQSFFHDTASATLSSSAYRDALEEVKEALRIAREELEKVASSALGKGRGVTIFNPVPWRRRALVIVDGFEQQLCIDGMPVPSQRLGDGAQLVEVELPALGFTVLEPCSDSGAADEARSGVEVEELRDEIKVIASGREFRVVEGGVVEARVGGRRVVDRGNELRVYRDFPREWDAWNVDYDYAYEEVEVSYGKPRVVERGPLRVCVETEARFLSSRVEQVICFDKLGLARFHSRAVVKDRHLLAKTWFRHSLVAHRAVIEAPLGVFERPLYASTSWERAKFEAWMNRWIAVAQNDIGFALAVTRGGKGIALTPQAIGYTLFRSPTYPHPLLDAGTIESSYTLYTFEGPWFSAGIHRLSIELELEPLALKGVLQPKLPRDVDLLEVEPPSLAIECVKPSENGKALVIHGYEASGSSAVVKVRAAREVRRVALCNWQETETREFKGSARPYQILCLYVETG
ncbi:MAG: alpha-mannosidase [Crenarchaeota archaeon]|nr:alpha-mannosidase [Thermoproteota archaeon]